MNAPKPNGQNHSLPGRGLLGWLGRQVGYVSRAIRHDPELVHRDERSEEKTDPNHPGLVFRRTVTDEVRRESKRLEER